MSKVHQVPASSTLGCNPVLMALNDAAPEITREQRASLDDIPEGKVIFEGKVRTRADVSEILTTREATSHGVTYFDLMESLSTKLVHPMLRARVMASNAWTLDSSIISTARSIFFDVYKDETEAGHIDNFADFLSKMSELRAGEDFAEGLGYELGAGRMKSLGTMMRVSTEWHDMARAAAANAKIKYDPKSFELLMASEKVQVVDVLTREKLAALIEVEYEDDENSTPEEAEQAKDMLIAQQTARNIQMHASRQMVAPAVLRIIEHVNLKHTAEDCNFWQLPLDMQIRLIGAARRTVDRTLTDLSTYRGISTLDYIGMIREAKAMKKELDTVLATGKFATH